MPRLTHKLPVPRLHRPSGRARLRIDGKEIWLGEFGSSAAQAEYDRLIGEWLANGRTLLPDRAPVSPLPVKPIREVPDPTVTTITILIAEFSQWAKKHYVSPDGSQTREAENFKCVTRPLRKLFGKILVTDFGPTKLIALRQTWIEKGLARRTINRMVGRVKQVFKWGTSRELVPVEVFLKLQTVEPLQPNRGGRETSGSRGSVPLEVIERTLPHLPPLIRAFVLILYHSGARVGEVARLTPNMIDVGGDVWSVDLDRHKNSHRGGRAAKKRLCGGSLNPF